MTAVVSVFGVIALVLGVLFGALGHLPGHGQDTVNAKPSVEQVSQRLDSSYTSIVQDLVSYIGDPDYTRAESQRIAMIDSASKIAVDFRSLAEELKNQENSVTQGAGANSPASGS